MTRSTGGTITAAFILLVMALVAETLLLNVALGGLPPELAGELLTLSKVVVGLTAVSEVGLLVLWAFYVRLALRNEAAH